MDNIELFELSRANSSLNFDFSNPKGVMVIPKSKDQENELTKANHKIIDYITTYKVIKDKPEAEELKKNIIKEIIRIIETTDHINYSSFCIYFQVLKYSYSAFMWTNTLTDEDKYELIKNTVELYIENRHDVYMSHGYSDQVLQVQSDAASSRRNGVTGTNSLSTIMESKGFSRAGSYADILENYAYILPDKGDNSILNEILSQNHIVFEFQKTRDNKNPDLAFVLDDDIFILEHKLTNGGGGSQNMEINEIISFIGYSENNKKIHYISCLQGDYLNKLNADNSEPKVAAQYQNIMNNLYANKSNYFVNEFGLSELIDFYKERS